MLNSVDDAKVSRLVSLQRDNVTCIECCKYYYTPDTALCGHSLCHSCWHGRRSCPLCAKPVNRSKLQPNTSLKNLTEHVKKLVETFEILFKVKLDEFALNTPMESEADPAKNVQAWLANSQNKFSAPPPNSQQSTQHISQPVELCKNNLQIHGESIKNVSPKKVVHIPPPQDDWDKIEEVQDTEDITKTNKENIAGPMDLEPFYIEDIEYSTDHPRRSSRRRDLKNESTSKPNDVSVEKQSSINSSTETDKKTKRQNWSNVKRMRKEFSKLNKQHRNKLNVSIEMCKKTNPGNNLQPLASPNTKQACIVIDDNTPNIINNVAHRNNAVEPVKEYIEVPVEPFEEVNINTSKVTTTNSEKNIQKAIHQDNKYVSKEISNVSSKNPTITEKRIPFIRKSYLHSSKCLEDIPVKPNENNININSKVNTDDIEISIKIGDTITNIMIKRNDVSLKLNTDREMQTTLPPQIVINHEKKCVSQNVNTVQINLESDDKLDSNQYAKIIKIDNGLIKGLGGIQKSLVSKKHTDSADTATAQFDITESVEKEMSNIMECVENDKKTKSNSNKTQSMIKTPVIDEILMPSVLPQGVPEDIEDLNELDIFASGSVKEAEVKLLKETINTPSEIFRPTAKGYKKTQKRPREAIAEDVISSNKKHKGSTKILADNSKEIEQDSENMNYDSIMGKVFATIDADIDEIQKSQKTNRTSIVNTIQESQISQMLPQTVRKSSKENIKVTETKKIDEYQNKNEKYSENIFSLIEKDSQDKSLSINKGGKKIPSSETQRNIDHLLTPALCEDFAALEDHTQTDENIEMPNQIPSTPCHEIDDSDKSVVEETPQKNKSFSKLKLKIDAPNKTLSNKNEQSHDNFDKISGAHSTSIINLTDTVGKSNKSTKDLTVIENIGPKKHVSETPLTINKFFDQIKHKSTPVAKKSLNFNRQNDNDDDPDQTLCSNTIAVAKTTQEKEFMSKAFEQTQSPKASQTNAKKAGLKYNIACSCLTPAEITNVKLLCMRNSWMYLDKYSKDVTHLIVGVDEEHKAQRSVKYMCALAAGKWIVSYNWIEQCFRLKTIIDEEPFEALDSTGDPGPRLSRLAKQKLFQGITFYCMQPYTVLNVESLQEMLLAAGGRVVNEASEVRVKDGSPSILLAEPEHTQEDKFIYMAMELSIVPVNYEWALNCLGCYSLWSIQDLLLCPASLLPQATKKWPAVLMNREFDSFS